MAFVFQAEKPSFISTKDHVPGPGYYDIPEQEVEPNYISFLSAAERGLNNLNKKAASLPGPGTYNLPVSVQTYNTHTKVMYSALNPKMESLEEPQNSTTFKSVTKRQPFSQHGIENPGPGTYHKESQVPVKNIGAHKPHTVMKQNEPHNGSVPSIPSVIHAYGYSETVTRGLKLNKNPLLEVPKYVGPGYYDSMASTDVTKPKGISWNKSKAPKSPDVGLQIGTGTNIGPGSYKIRTRGIFPLYKLKPSGCFASGSGRTGFTETKAKQKKSSSSSKRTTNLMEETTRDDDMDENMTPGPGYYYNSSTTSSFPQQYKPLNSQFFGSGSERFGDGFSNKTNMGPGKYNIGKDIARKIQKNPNMQVPFVTAVKRFNEKPEDVPGPGNYDVVTKVGNEIVSTTAKPTVESFGATELRFRNAQDGVPGPGAYYQKDKEKDEKSKDKSEEKGAKTSHMFTSSTKREAIRVLNAHVPPPGSYDVNNFDMSTKVNKEEYEDPDFNPKRPAFNTATERFKNTTAKIDEEDDNENSFEEDWLPDGHTRGDLILKVRNQPKLSAAFSSTTKRVGVPVNNKNFVPGPGKYYGPVGDEWIKKTYNVNFTTD